MNRLTYIDVTKGLLMMIVIYYHVLCILRITCVDIYNENNQIIFETPNLFRAFFMSGFFFVSGVTSKFSRSTKEQLINDFKTLLLPSFIICTITAIFYPKAIENGEMGIIEFNLLFGGGAWFITAMFLARQIYRILLIIKNEKYRLFVISVIWAVAFLLDNEIPVKYQLWHFPKALLFMPFLEFGRSFNIIENNKLFDAKVCLVVYMVIIVFLMKNGLIPPFVTDGNYVELKWIPVFLITSITGCVVIYKIGKYIYCNSLMEFVGKNSLVFYLTHMTFLFLAGDYLANNYSMSFLSLWTTCLIVFLLFGAALLWSTAFAYVLNLDISKWILGKF